MTLSDTTADAGVGVYGTIDAAAGPGDSCGVSNSSVDGAEGDAGSRACHNDDDDDCGGDGTGRREPEPERARARDTKSDTAKPGDAVALGPAEVPGDDVGTAVRADAPTSPCWRGGGKWGRVPSRADAAACGSDRDTYPTVWKNDEMRSACTAGGSSAAQLVSSRDAV
jgi:hypothetical protein